MGNKRDLGVLAAIVAYLLAGLTVSLLGRLVFPLQAPPLKPFIPAWHLVEGLLLFIYLYPSLLLSALVAPFGFGHVSAGDGDRFTPAFLASMKKHLLAAIAASGLYAILFLLAQPLLQDVHSGMLLRGRLFSEAKIQTEAHVENKLWREAANYLAVCEQIWPQSPETEKLRNDVKLGLAELRSTLTDSPTEARPEYPSLPLDKLLPPGFIATGMTVSDALRQARLAFRDRNYFDSHWFAGLASRLAKEGSPEEAEATILATRAWNALTSLEPKPEDLFARRLHLRKREGYTALQSEDWVRGYYIYKELSAILPRDPDVQKFLAKAEQGTTRIAFFSDEVTESLGEVSLSAVLSLPLRNNGGLRIGTMVLTSETLASFGEVSYGTGLQFRMYDLEGNSTSSLRTRYAKFLPFNLGPMGDDVAVDEGRAQTLVLLTALDREDSNLRWTPQWSDTQGSPAERTQIILDIPYEDLHLALKARSGPSTLTLGELQRGGRTLGDYGFLPQAFQGELIRRFYEPLNLLVLCILFITIGWRLRSQRGAGVVGIPLMVVLPLVFDPVVQSSRLIAQLVSLRLILVLPYIMALPIMFGVGSLLVFLTLVFLAGQRG